VRFSGHINMWTAIWVDIRVIDRISSALCMFSMEEFRTEGGGAGMGSARKDTIYTHSAAVATGNISDEFEILARSIHLRDDLQGQKV